MSTIGREPLIMKHNSDKLYESVALCKSDVPELIKKATYDVDMLLCQGIISKDMHINYLHQLDYLTTEFKKFCMCKRISQRRK